MKYGWMAASEVHLQEVSGSLAFLKLHVLSPEDPFPLQVSRGFPWCHIFSLLSFIPEAELLLPDVVGIEMALPASPDPTPVGGSVLVPAVLQSTGIPGYAGL